VLFLAASSLPVEELGSPLFFVQPAQFIQSMIMAISRQRHYMGDIFIRAECCNREEGRSAEEKHPGQT
jgi:hypothetical protein